MTKNKIAKKATASKTSKTVSTSEIKQWLRGILEFQPAEFTPTAQQWAVIRDKIFALDETVPEYTASFEAQHRQTPQQQQQRTQSAPQYTPGPIAEVEEPYVRSAIEGAQDDVNLTNTRVAIGGAVSSIQNEHGGVSVAAQTDQNGNYVTSFV